MAARDELSLLARFASVGVIVTIVHFSVAFSLVRWGGWPAQSANLAGFALAFGLSFVSHYQITFRSGRGYGSALPRFIIVALFAYAASVALLFILETFSSLPAALSVVLAAAIIPVFTYVAGRWWVF